MQIPEAARDHYRTMLGLQTLVVKAGQQSWSQVTPTSITASWLQAMIPLLPVVETAQRRAALEGSAYSAAALAEQASYTAPAGFVDVDAFAGYASDGRSLESLLYRPAAGTMALVAGGMRPSLALQSGLGALTRILATQIADTGRLAGGVDVAAREGVGYVRMVRPGACSRCVIQAGKWFRWNSGFLRHPQCTCVHVANRAGSTQAALDEGLLRDPYESFRRLSPAEQDSTFGQMNAAAIRDGADISQVVNAFRGMSTNGNFTTEGTKRGNAAGLLKPGQRRMTPELIYKMAKDRGEALELLQYHGFILPGGQVPTGALRGQVEGFGQLGGGGARKAAREAIEKARETGIRDPRNRYTMTAAERRLYDAEQNYITALAGRSPYTSPGFGNTPDPYGQRLNRIGAGSRPVTEAEMATAERAYRAALASNGDLVSRENIAPGAIATTQADAVTSAGGSGQMPPRQPPTPGGAEPDPSDREAWLAYWKARQDRLGIGTGGDVLEPHEVEFLEKFQALGHRVKWIPRDTSSSPRLPTNDFVWLDKGEIFCELKSTSAKYARVRFLVRRSVSRAAVRGVVKENFILDLGDKPLSASLRQQLEQYNRRQSDHQIARLWVMARGQLTEIRLA